MTGTPELNFKASFLSLQQFKRKELVNILNWLSNYGELEGLMPGLPIPALLDDAPT